MCLTPGKHAEIHTARVSRIRTSSISTVSRCCTSDYSESRAPQLPPSPREKATICELGSPLRLTLRHLNIARWIQPAIMLGRTDACRTRLLARRFLDSWCDIYAILHSDKGGSGNSTRLSRVLRQIKGAGSVHSNFSSEFKTQDSHPAELLL